MRYQRLLSNYSTGFVWLPVLDFLLNFVTIETDHFNNSHKKHTIFHDSPWKYLLSHFAQFKVHYWAYAFCICDDIPVGRSKALARIRIRFSNFLFARTNQHSFHSGRYDVLLWHASWTCQWFASGVLSASSFQVLFTVLRMSMTIPQSFSSFSCSTLSDRRKTVAQKEDCIFFYICVCVYCSAKRMLDRHTSPGKGIQKARYKYHHIMVWFLEKNTSLFKTLNCLADN